MNVIFIGDIVGKPGRKFVKKILPELKNSYSIDFVIANGENLAGGIGLTKETVDEIIAAGADVITTGNHIWAKKDSKTLLDEYKDVIRPINYPEECPGKGYIIKQVQNKCKIAVINALGRIYTLPIDCPFKAIERILPEIKLITPIIIVDFHAEATSEKNAMGWFLDGKVSAVIGTHTHIQTADEKILPNGTAYITDVGMVGPYDSIIGMDKETSLSRFLTQIPEKFEVAKGLCIFSAVVISIDERTYRSTNVSRLLIKEEK